VKIFNTLGGQLLYRLRRGAAPADIHCLTFQSDRFVAVASCSSSTVHIFKLDANIGTSGDDDSFCSATFEQPTTDAYPVEPKDRADSIATQLQKAVALVVPSYFSDIGTFAQFRLPDCDANGQSTVDTRSKQARIVGPKLGFHRSEPRLYVLHYNGVLYECCFSLDHNQKDGTQDCSLAEATTWFAVRRDFRLQGPPHKLPTVAGGATDDGDDNAEEWLVL